MRRTLIHVNRIQRNSTVSPLLRLPLEIRERIWSMVLGGGLLHVRFEALHDYFSDDSEKEMVLSPNLKVWSAKYCTVKDSTQLSTAVSLAEAVSVGHDSTEPMDIHPHYVCHERPDLLDLYHSPEDQEQLEHSKKDYKPYLQVLRTCRQVYLEASRTLWTTNTFSFSDPDVLKRFMNDRKMAQKQLLKKLHLDVRWLSRGQKRAWDRALTLTLVRSLKGLRKVDLYIEQDILNRYLQIDSNPMFGSPDHLKDEFFVELMKLKILPLESVAVHIANGLLHPSYVDEGPQWPVAGRTKWAERLRSQLLDPDGARLWKEYQDRQTELLREKKEREAQERAQTICHQFSTEETCAQQRQKLQDEKDKSAGRVRKEKKVVGPCGRQHMCTVCLWEDIAESSEEAEKKARGCPRPGDCGEKEASNDVNITTA